VSLFNPVLPRDRSIDVQSLIWGTFHYNLVGG